MLISGLKEYLRNARDKKLELKHLFLGTFRKSGFSDYIFWGIFSDIFLQILITINYGFLDNNSNIFPEKFTLNKCFFCNFMTQVNKTLQYKGLK
jgi:hypothetical protein